MNEADQMKRSIAVGLVLMAMGVLTGCATSIVHEGKYAQSDGWREGTVVEIGPAKDLQRPAFYDCRDQVSEKENDVSYVTIAFLRNGHPYARTAKLPTESKLRVGDKVYVNIKDCTAPIPARSS